MAVVVQGGAVCPDGVDIVIGETPDAVQVGIRAAVHHRPVIIGIGRGGIGGGNSQR
jgi:hypothetical protein